jgi:hypothetical protein
VSKLDDIDPDHVPGLSDEKVEAIVAEGFDLPHLPFCTTRSAAFELLENMPLRVQIETGHVSYDHTVVDAFTVGGVGGGDSVRRDDLKRAIAEYAAIIVLRGAGPRGENGIDLDAEKHEPDR